MSVHVAKQRQKLILQDLRRLKRKIALYPSAYVRITFLPKIRELEKMLE